ncbi:hypothetical protein B0H66DRAFT_541537 [Apodospora peruviana]|uniref:Uncharacterized protein n=1 Tax=Apodospora peruviana TaxID=516989 RepID=A0AAE0MET8_9PEZI|nr:hypothetical protein B0H66DRAFT_541537 [Apodospora peruviana]
MNSVTAYSFASLAWLSTQALPLIIWPSFISSMLTTVDIQRGHHIPVNAVEQYFARSLGFSQLAAGLLIVVLSGALPLTSLVDTPAETVSPYADAVVLVSMLYHASNCFYAYMRYTGSGGQIGYLLGSLGSGVMATFALWIMLFANDKGHISRRTGADKRTSGFPFRNSEADKRNLGKPKDL